ILTVYSEEVQDVREGIIITDSICIIGGRKLHVFFHEHMVLDLNTYYWSIVRSPSVDAAYVNTT
ncbi:hypothetical protein PFISCL1PPCAC_12115, partial [Pristionchus fissidentatus]